jgi:translation initiation factor IF-3
VVDGSNSQQLGVMTPQEALAIARNRGLDLVEIAPTAQPPVCKIVDYGKWKYEQAKHEKEKHKHKSTKVKEIKLRASIDPHDYRIKMTRAEDFLWHGDKLRVMLQFRGREMAHPELGMELMHKVVADLKTIGHVDMSPRQTGKTINMTLSPLPSHQRVRKFRQPGEEYVLGEDDRHEHDDESDHVVHQEVSARTA